MQVLDYWKFHLRLDIILPGQVDVDFLDHVKRGAVETGVQPHVGLAAGEECCQAEGCE